MSLLSIAALGMNRAAQRFERGADALMQSVTGGAGDAAGAIVDTIAAKAQFKASAALVRVSDEMMSDLLALQRDR